MDPHDLGAPAGRPNPGLVEGGPAVVALGGGHGLSASLRAVRRYAGSVTAVVSVADDGGSSGVLRAALPDLPAPGDVRKCLGALAEEGSTYGRVLEHRFGEGELEGHAIGNLLLVALSQELGSFSAAVDEVARRVGAVGRVLPATSEAVDLRGWRTGSAAVDGPGAPIDGQVAVQNASGVFQVCLEPPEPVSAPEVGAAIRAADQVVIGPGSLFTSVLAAAVVPAVRDALAATSAQRVYVANLAPQLPETAGFSVADELDALARHEIPVDVVVTDPGRPVGLLEGGGSGGPVPVSIQPVASASGRVHDPELLAAALAALLA